MTPPRLNAQGHIVRPNEVQPAPRVEREPSKAAWIAYIALYATAALWGIYYLSIPAVEARYRAGGSGESFFEAATGIATLVLMVAVTHLIIRACDGVESIASRAMAPTRSSDDAEARGE